MKVRAPWTYMGNKQRVAEEVWSRLPGTQAMIDPFGGSMALYLKCPWQLKMAILGDANGEMINAWRAIAADDTVIDEARSWPVDHWTLMAPMPKVSVDLTADSRAYDREAAVHWIYRAMRSVRGGNGTDSGLVMTRSIRSLPDKVDQRRLREKLDPAVVTLEPRDWKDTLLPSRLAAAKGTGKVAVFLDPPYDGYEQYYKDKRSIAEEVYDWARDNYSDQVRIVVFGHVGDAPQLAGFVELTWGRPAPFNSRPNEREAIWLSPCEQESLF